MGLSRPMRLDAARRLMTEGRHAEADRLADDLLADSPRDMDALVLKSAVLIAAGDRERAFVLLGRLAEAAPERADVSANLGLLHRVEGRGAEARFCYERAVDLAPAEGAYSCALVSILLSLGDIDAARERLRSVAALEGLEADIALQAEIHGLDARIALLENRPTAAERAVRRALALRPEEEGDLILLSDALAQTGQRQAALETAELAYLRAPASHDGVCLLARRLMEAGRMEEAERHLVRTVAVAPLHVEAAFLLAHARIARGETAEALAPFAALVRRVPDDADLLMRMATLLRLTGDLEKALACASEAARRAPSTPSFETWRDELKLALGRVDEVWPVRADVPNMPDAVLVPPGIPAGEALLLARFAQGTTSAEPPVCHLEAALVPLLDGVPGLRLSVEPAPPEAISLGELPRRRGTTAQPPYLAVEASRLDMWRQALEAFKRPWIGLYWDDAAGFDLASLAAWVESVGPECATLVSLAFDGRRQDLQGRDSILDAGARFRDAKDLAACVALLDFAVCADGLPAHVAGALGRPGIVAVPPAQPWSWAHREGRSIWYPSLHVVRGRDVARTLDANPAVCADFARAVLAGAGGEEE
ncbi:tetratricopeptide repeat protein [Aquabacter cavernae]|uniref:tetratricopeptide repeat protein n=1 Tax=Aquabacter cavernae TaxID=2496029 RepID=UPI000F8D9E06|nr:tetratricopeptide repeat protein [Aquabacter cavernae]